MKKNIRWRLQAKWIYNLITDHNKWRKVFVFFLSIIERGGGGLKTPFLTNKSMLLKYCRLYCRSIIVDI